MIDDIRAKIVRGRFEFSKHAVDQTIIRGVTVDEIRQAISAGEIIEDYPDDKYGASCLVFGQTESGCALHVQCSHRRAKSSKSVPSMNLIQICGWTLSGE